MSITLTKEQMASLISKANRETEREIYYINFDSQDITINGSWSISRDEKTPINLDIVRAIETYCTKQNIDWEYTSEYSSWCD